MREQYMRTGDGFLICYSVTDRRSFDEAQEYKTLVNRVRNSEDNVIPCVLVGNKCDLDHLRKVWAGNSLTIILIPHLSSELQLV